ncbi:MAG: S1-like domain-containing RNA-binding protein [Lachnospiraceae bacterium]|jgi:predicted RNA-binding protein (virulence factor B family)|nr:S1-like domain-containing RNA-binding protein [Lachnospiraceae bacterium]
MIELGKYQELTVVRKEEFGVYLGESRAAGPDERILLPKRQVPAGTEMGNKISVFVYRDSEDRMIATVSRPLIALHEVAVLKVAEVTKIGAFLSWGLEKDLLLPYAEQTKDVHKGEEVLAALYIDKSGRLAATMNVYPYLSTDSPYHEGDSADGLVYQFAHNFGYFVAVDRKYSGMVPIREAQSGFQIGQTLTFRVTRVLEDGKLNLSAKKKAFEQLEPDAEKVLKKIRDDFNGTLPFDDKADPEKIKEVFGLSKAAFKRAAGHLYKERKIEIGKGFIKANDT